MIAAALLAAGAVVGPADAADLDRRIDAAVRAARWNELRSIADEVAAAPEEVRRPALRHIARELCAGPGCAAATGILQDAIALGGEDAELWMLRAFEAAERGALHESLAPLERLLDEAPGDDWSERSLDIVSRSLLARNAPWPEEPPYQGWSLLRVPQPPGPAGPASEHLDALRREDWTLPEVVTKVEPEFPRAKAPKGASSPRVVLECAVLRTGHVVPIRVLDSAGKAFTESTLAAVRRWRYMPARYRGEIVALRYTVLVRFVNRKSS